MSNPNNGIEDLFLVLIDLKDGFSLCRARLETELDE